VALAWAARPGGRAALLVAALGATLGWPAPAWAVGPSFACAPPPPDALARVTCSDATLAGAEIRTTQTYYARREQVGQEQGAGAQNQLRDEYLAFLAATREHCGLPPAAPGADQSDFQPPTGAAACLVNAYIAERNTLAQPLRDGALDEAARAPEANIALQQALKVHGFLPANAVIDGVFGSGTRAAIRAWQVANGRVSTGFLADADAQALAPNAVAAAPTTPGAAPPSAPPDRLAAIRSQPLAEGTFNGNDLTLHVAGLALVLHAAAETDASKCGLNDAVLPSARPPAAGDEQCRVITLQLSENGATTWQGVLSRTTSDASYEFLDITVAIRRLDPQAAQPAITLSAYTGGAHCCTSTTALVKTADGTWQKVELGNIDGDTGFAYLDPAHEGFALLVDTDGRFLYRFSSYAGSNPPTRIRRLSGTALIDVTKDPRYRDFLVGELQRGEQRQKHQAGGEINGYLAGWVAQDALIGRFAESWPIMLRQFDGKAYGETWCALAQRAWPRRSGAAECPRGYAFTVPYPTGLALFLVDAGYVTPEQMRAAGVDTAQVLADRALEGEAMTAVYELKHAPGWLVVDTDGACVPAPGLSSPARIVFTDRMQNVEDQVSVLDADTNGRPLAVVITSPARPGPPQPLYRDWRVCARAAIKLLHAVDKLR
jgi:peptidoglycan hydrolase-like protein with peptidoglycan-binding domain